MKQHVPDASPAVRAHYSRVALRRLRAMPGGRGHEIRALIGEDVIRSIRGIDPMAWLPMAIVLRICDAIYAVLGEDGARSFWSELMFDTYDRGMLRPLTSLARDPGRDRSAGPKALLELAPQAWELSSRSCGHIELTRDAHGGFVMSSIDLPTPLVRSRGFHCVFFGACQAMLAQFRSPGSVTVRRVDDRLLYSVRFED